MSERDTMGESGAEMLSASGAPQPNDSAHDSSINFFDGNYGQITPDVNTLRAESRLLKNRIRGLQNDLQAEQDTVSTLRRKLTSIERDRLDAVSKANEDVSRLDSELTRLRAQLEKGEAVRQNLEYELAKAKRDLGLEKRSFQERENSSAEVMESLKQKTSELSRQVEMLLTEVDSGQQVLKKQEEVTRAAVSQRDAALASLQAQREAADTHKAQMETNAHQKDSVIRELEDRISELEDEGRQHTDSLRRQVGETELIREREDRIKQELQTTVSRVKSLEESIEAERAAHLESKFNSEIIQLRIRDLESALEMEKSAKNEALAGKEKANKQIRDLQKVYEDERKNGQEQEERIKQAEQEYAGLTKQLQGDLSDKREVINRLSSELDNHAREFADVKAELTKAKKRQVYLEETYSGCMKELELLLDNFRLDSSPKGKTVVKTGPPTHLAARRAAKSQASSSTSTKSEGGKKGLAPAVIMESLRHTLIAYKRKTDELSTDLVKTKAQLEVSSKENGQYKAQVLAKERALETSKKAATKSTQEISSLQEAKRELEGRIRDLKAQLDNAKKTHEREQKDLQTKNEQIVMEYLRGVYHQLVVALPHDLPPMEQHIPNTFPQLSLLVTEQTARIISALKSNTDRLHEMERAAGNKEETIASLQRAHAEQLQQLATAAEERSAQWQQQRQQLEAHFAQRIKDVHSQHKKTQALADKGWEQLRVTGSLQQGLEKECQHMQEALVQVQKEHDTLLTTCALLCGALYPLYGRNNQLARERAVLSEHCSRLEAFKAEVQQLVSALSPEPPLPSYRRPLLVFRAGVVAVMAANRLAHLAHTRSMGCMFVVKDALPGESNMLVCSGRQEEDGYSQGFAGVSKALSKQRAGEGEEEDEDSLVLRWLTSGDLKTNVMACVSDLQAVLQCAREGETVEQHRLVREARAGFQKLLRHLPSSFPGIPSDAGHSGSRDKGSLLRLLHYGLARALDVVQEDEQPGMMDYYETSQATLGKLQSHVVEFTRRLHGAEVERRDLRSQLSTLLAEKQQWAESGATPDEIHMMQKQMENCVARDKFEHVCGELNQALKREQKAQKLLNEQSNQIQRLSGRIDSQSREGSQKEHTLSEAVAGLTEAKMELKRQEQRLKNLQRQLQQSDGEKQILNENIADAEKALRTAARDREALAEYCNNIERMLNKVQLELGPGSVGDYTQLLSPHVLPRNMSKAGPELVVCQRLVTAFVDAHRQVASRVEGFRGEIDAQRQHIETLKKELSAACKRDYADELNKLESGDGKGDPAERDVEFYPLIEDISGSSFGVPRLATPTKVRTTRSGLPTRQTNTKQRKGVKS